MRKSVGRLAHLVPWTHLSHGFCIWDKESLLEGLSGSVCAYKWAYINTWVALPQTKVKPQKAPHRNECLKG